MKKKDFLIIMAKFMGIIFVIATGIGGIFFILKKEYVTAVLCGVIARSLSSFLLNKN